MCAFLNVLHRASQLCVLLGHAPRNAAIVVGLVLGSGNVVEPDAFSDGGVAPYELAWVELVEARNLQRR